MLLDRLTFSEHSKKEKQIQKSKKVDTREVKVLGYK